MKHAFVIASLLLVQASAFATERSNTVNAEPTPKASCWKTHATGGQLEPQRLIHPATYVEDTTKTFEKAAQSRRTI